MAYDTLYIVIISIITLIVLYYYFYNEYNNSIEVEKIKRLEFKYEQKQKELEEIRSQTIPCPVIGLNNPRDCYFGSNGRCSWNELAIRCDSI